VGLSGCTESRLCASAGLLRLFRKIPLVHLLKLRQLRTQRGIRATRCLQETEPVHSKCFVFDSLSESAHRTHLKLPRVHLLKLRQLRTQRGILDQVSSTTSGRPNGKTHHSPYEREIYPISISRRANCCRNAPEHHIISSLR
jgi:hypothetical protein